MTPPVCLSVAATDSGGAAGLAADLATFAARGVHGACAVTAVTAQDTTGVSAVHQVPPEMARAQVEAVLGDLPVGAAKTGMAGHPDVVHLVADMLGGLPLVVDPVMVASSGARLATEEVVRAYREVLLPVATVVTPNADEAERLLGRAGDPREQAGALAERGAAVVLTGGETGVDWLALPGEAALALPHPAVATSNDHGTGCTFSAALAAALARRVPLTEAVEEAAAFTHRQLRLASTWDLGRGRGPIAHTTREGAVS